MAERYLLQNPKAAWRVYDGEAVIVSPEDSMLHTLNEIGTLVWEAADGQTPLTAVVARICGLYDTDAATVERDVMAFVARLREQALISVLDAPASGT